jgi:arylsulfatase A-like enzyme
MNSRPNIVLILTDQERYIPPYEKADDGLVDLRNKHLVAHKMLERHSVSFHNHYTEATACVPSRASIFLSKEAYVHGLKQTPGLAKTDHDPAIKWLDGSIPTMGNVFREIGYDTYYFGKWHLTGDPTPDELEKCGFSCWGGTEPHGPQLYKSGSVMDSKFVDEAIDTVKNRTSDKPFLLVLSLVNPHDIVLISKLSLLMKQTNTFNYKFPFPPESQTPLPEVIQAFKKLYPTLMIPQWLHNIVHSDDNAIKNFYFDLMVKVDKEILRFMNFFTKTKYYSNTFVFFTSDHGDMLGAKDIQQKWYTPYQEAIHVPFMIHHQKIPFTVNYDCLTSSLDILPTMIGLATSSDKMYNVNFSGINLRSIVAESFNGFYVYKASDYRRSVIFETEDDIVDGKSNYPVYYNLFPSTTKFLLWLQGRTKKLYHPKYIRTVMSFVPVRKTIHLHKLSQYYYNGSEYWELFDLSADPCETINLINDFSCYETIAHLKSIMIRKFNLSRM